MDCKRLSVAIVLLFGRPALTAEPPDRFAVADNVVAISEASNQFATELYAQLAADKSTNLFFSPYSIFSALAMTYSGSAGRTKSQMAQVLHFPNQESDLHCGLKELMNNLPSRDDRSRIELQVANRLWGQEGLHYLPAFLQVNKSDYGTELGLLDFKKPESARKTINSWIEKQTDRKIPIMIAPGGLGSDSGIVLTNAIYFKARWKEEFHKSATFDASFHISETRQTNVSTMNKIHEFYYAESETLQVLELPYGQDRSLSMVILLPNTIDGWTDLEKQLSSEKLQEWTAGMKPTKVEVRLPKFKMAMEFGLKDVLKSMGLSHAFTHQADFSRMSTQEPLFISAVIHKTYVEVNEEGTKAVAASGISLFKKSKRSPEDPVEFRADHPFVFVIRHNRTGCLLFLGRVLNPKG